MRAAYLRALLALAVVACTPSAAAVILMRPATGTAGSTPGAAAAATQSAPPSASPTFTPVPVPPQATPSSMVFDGQRAYQDVLAQMAIGSRPAGSAGDRQTGDYILKNLQESGWTTEEESFTYKGVPIRNVIGRKGTGPVVILGAHYDTRKRADQDPTNPSAPVPGADDGASGVAVLLELARTLDMSKVPYTIRLAFFDAEDDGELDGWDWSVGANYMAQAVSQSPAGRPRFVVVVDMVGDADQQIYLENNSTPIVRDPIWAAAARLGYGSAFIPKVKWSMTDDHTPFLQRGIPAVDIIDFDYPYWHTTADTADKVRPTSLERVGRTLAAFLEGPPIQP